MLEDLLKHGRVYSRGATLLAMLMSAPAYSAERAPAGGAYAPQSRPNVYYIEPKPKREEPSAEEEEEKKEEEKETEKKPELEYSPPAEETPRKFEYRPLPPPSLPREENSGYTVIYGVLTGVGVLMVGFGAWGLASGRVCASDRGTGYELECDSNIAGEGLSYALISGGVVVGGIGVIGLLGGFGK